VGWARTYDVPLHLMAVVAAENRVVIDEGYLERTAAAIEGVEVLTDRLQGSPVKALVARAAEIDGSLLVVCTHGRRGLDRLAAGSVASGVVAAASRPVLMVHPSVGSSWPTRT
jgi:nucleotide-binding universal stress UspA family protein